MTTELLAPAKLTLSLRILGTRADGFHELEALTVSIDTPADVLTIGTGPRGVRLELDGDAAAGVPDGDENLVVRAARAVLPDGAGLVVRLHKRIPPGSGLGGGSSDAAAVLRACATAHGLDAGTVVAAAALVGSDVPFCLHQAPAWMRGRGEVIDPVDIAEPLRVLVVTPPFSINTATAYRVWDELGGPRSDREIEPPAAVADVCAALANDLEPAAERVEPRLDEFRSALEAAAGAPALLAGSGSSCWVPFDDPDEWQAAGARVEAALGVTAHRATVVPAGATP